MNKNILCLFTVLLLVTPLMFAPFLPEPYELPKAMMFVMLTPILLGLALPTKIKSYSIILHTLLKINTRNIQLLFLLFICWIVLVSFGHGSWQISFWGQAYRYQGILFWTCGWILMMIVAHHKNYKIPIYLLLKMIALSGVIHALIIISQWLLITYFQWNIYTYNNRVSGLMGNANFAGGYLALTIAPLSLLFQRRYNQILSLLVVTTAIVLTGSLSSCISAGSVYIIMYWKKIGHLYRYILCGSFVFAILLSLLHRPLSSFDNRPTIWQKSVGAIQSRPIGGWGWERFERGFASQLNDSDFDLKNIRVDNAHNLWLNIATSAGIPGLFLYVMLQVALVRQLRRNRSSPEGQLLLAMIVGFELYGMLNVIAVAQYIVWFTIVGCIASLNFEYQPKKA